MTNHVLDINCSWPSRCAFSPATQSWQIARSGWERSLTHQSTDIEQHAQVVAMVAMVRGWRPRLCHCEYA